MLIAEHGRDEREAETLAQLTASVLAALRRRLEIVGHQLAVGGRLLPLARVCTREFVIVLVALTAQRDALAALVRVEAAASPANRWFVR